MRIYSNAERSKAIRERIKKELGYNSRQVSIRSCDCGYSDETRVTVKDLACDIDAIKKIAKCFESIRRDEYSGEILSGGNTYIIVEYDWEVLHKADKEIVSLDFNSLFHSLQKMYLQNGEKVQTVFDYVVRTETSGTDVYYDLYKMNGNLRLCCDGEQCKVLERTAEYVKLIDVENIGNDELDGIDTTFKLSVDEFNIATNHRG